MQIGWRPGDLRTGYLPFTHGVGSQVGFSDPVFMAKHGLPITHEHPAFPYEPSDLENPDVESHDHSAFDDALRARKTLAFSWIAEMSSGTYRSWADIPLIRNNWHGPLIFKGFVAEFLRPCTRNRMLKMAVLKLINQDTERSGCGEGN
jgi:lactate 2-monooxygenase